MGNRFASGKRAISECDICGFRYKLKELQQLVIKTKNVNILACPECWNPDHPQLQLGMYPVDDPQALRNPRPDFPGYPESRSLTITVPILVGPVPNPTGLGQVIGNGFVGNVTIVIT
jgi:hypothetical protein